MEKDVRFQENDVEFIKKKAKIKSMWNVASIILFIASVFLFSYDSLKYNTYMKILISLLVGASGVLFHMEGKLIQSTRIYTEKANRVINILSIMRDMMYLIVITPNTVSIFVKGVQGNLYWNIIIVVSAVCIVVLSIILDIQREKGEKVMTDTPEQD